MAPESEDEDELYDSDLLEEAAENDNEIHALREETFEERFKAASRAIKKKKRFMEEIDIDEFFFEFSDVVGESSPKVASNLLHALVEVVKHTDEIEPEHVELLIQRLVEKYPDLLKYQNKDGADNDDQSTYRACLDEALSMKCQGGRTCLHLALKEKFDLNTAKMLIENASDEALAVQDDAEKTPMHYAVSSQQCTSVRVQLIDLFIKRDLRAIQKSPRSEKTFLDLADKRGSSIYSEHRKTRASVIKTLDSRVARQPPVVEGTKRDQTDVSRPNERPAPIEPRSQANAGDPRYLASAKPTGDSESERFGPRNDAKSKLDEREKLRQRRKAEEAAAKKPKESESLLRVVIDSQANNEAREPAPNTSIKRTNTGRDNDKPDKKKEKPTVRPPLTNRKSTDPAKAKARWIKNSDKILLNLKLHYMRTRNAEMVILFLYGTNMDDVQISFDYDRLPRKMIWNEFTERFGADTKSGLKFDSVLQYVTFPHVEVRLKGRLADLQRDAEPMHRPGDFGREDMKYFFNWLYKKGVRHIIKLSVEDSGDSGEKVHSDQAIQESTKQFIVEELDWQKTDLDPETILHVSSEIIEKEAPTPDNPRKTELVPDRQLKHLYLRWSGSNAVLRAWSEPEGLPMLPRLQHVHVYKPPSDKSYDNLQWINDKIKQFGIRLNESRKTIRARELAANDNQAVSNVGIASGDVQVTVSDAGIYEERKVMSHNAADLTTLASTKGVDSHRWLDSTVRFAGEMIPFWNNTVQDFLKSTENRGTPERVEDDVVLALIDDGVDMFDKTLTNQVLEGKSFDFHDSKVRPPFSSARGHGTVMASMILRVCPMAKVYPIRLKTYDKENGKTEIDRNYAAQAIQAALDKKATIISMSWTLPMTDDKSHSKDQLHTVLQKAVSKNVLMFCSAPDGGKFDEPDYPSGPWRDRFFRIGAAHADGSVFKWTQEDGITYVLPGVEVIKDQVGRSGSFETSLVKGVSARVVDFKYETGSSVATALAAGLAAMIIYCVKASILTVKTANQNKGSVVGIAIQDNGANLIADPDAMKRAFASLGTVTRNHFIQVWEELDKVSEMLETSRVQSSNQEAKRACIEGFVEFGHKLANSTKP
ncbi:hypothetical protein F4804DRAFT_336702 [Jackrogersella minutella]|nr:hypothetical protein F4804DRAFT_336702 [Jackrogersella minutella]